MGREISASYVTIEDISSGLFKTQVQAPLTSIANRNPEIKIHIYAIIYFWRWLGEKKSLKEVRDQLSLSGIKLTVIPLLIPVKFTTKSRLYCKIFLNYLAVLISLLPRVDLFHCRGYFTTISATLARRKEKLIFDMRSLWILENLAAKRLSPGSPVTSYWHDIEELAVSRSDAIIGVSAPMGDYIKPTGHLSKYSTIPISVDLQAFNFCPSLRSELRSQFGWSDEDIVGVYSGSLGLAGLNITSVANLMAFMNRCQSKLKFLILSNEPRTAIDSLCKMAGVKPGDVVVASLCPTRVGEYLSAADFGFHALPPQPDSKTRLGTKVVEYWANGLPVILSETVGAAAAYCKTHELGLVVNLEGSITDIRPELPTRSRLNTNLELFDVQQFGLDSVSDAYARIYVSLVERVGKELA